MARTIYDEVGRTKAVVSPVVNAAGGIHPLTVFKRDALGNVTVRTEYASGEGVSGSGRAASEDPNLDRTTRTRYDRSGNAIEIIDAEWHREFKSYDAAGRLAKQWRTVEEARSDGTSSSGPRATLFQVFGYDAAGHQTTILTPGSNSAISADGKAIIRKAQAEVPVVVTRLTYNGFGEMVRRWTRSWGDEPKQEELATLEYRDDFEFFEYDDAGRLWRTNAGDGVVKVMLYDLQGNLTVQITSDGTADLMDFDSAQQIDQYGQSSVIVEKQFESSGHTAIERVVFAGDDAVETDDVRLGQCRDRA